MELWRTNVDHAVLQTLEEMRKSKGKKFGFTDKYEVEITADSAKLLLEKNRFSLSLEEIIFNARLLSKFILGENKKLAFRLRSIETRRKDTIQTKHLIRSKTFKELGLNKSTLWYQKRRLEETGSLRIYNKTRHHFI
jgi:CRISP-associated protein Cas1